MKNYTIKLSHRGPLYDRDEETSAATRRVWTARGCRVKPRAVGFHLGRNAKHEGLKLFTPSQVELSYAVS